MLHWLPVASYPSVFAAVFRVLKPGGWYHSESAGSGNVPRVLEVLDDVAVELGIPTAPEFPNTGVVFDLVEEAGFEIGDDGVRTVTQRRPFTRDQLVGFLRTQATVALTRFAPEAKAAAIREAVVAQIDRLRRADGTYDETFVRLEILVRRPA